jgi:hypothetical protein
MSSSSLNKFHERADEAIELVRRNGSDSVTYKAGIVLLAAAWEIYIELLISECANFIAYKAVDSSVIPVGIKRRICNTNLTSDGRQKHDNFAWLFTENNWRNHVVQFALAQVETFNTPNSQNVRDLFEKVLDHPDICRCWKRTGNMNSERACVALNEWLSYRHSIAHGSREEPFIRRDVERFRDFLEATVKKMEDELAKYLETMVGVIPW